MAAKVSNFSDLVQRVAASCLLHPLGAGRNAEFAVNGAGDEDDFSELELDEPEDEVIGGGGFKAREEGSTKEVMEMEMAMWEVFDSISAMKKAYAGLQKAHSPWDPEKMRAADVAVVGELRKLGVLRERFRRRCSSGGGRGGGGVVAAGTLREVVAPYEAAVEELKKEVKAKEVEVDNLKDKLNNVVNGSNGNNGKKGRSISRRKVGCSQLQGTKTLP